MDMYNLSIDDISTMAGGVPVVPGRFEAKMLRLNELPDDFKMISLESELKISMGKEDFLEATVNMLRIRIKCLEGIISDRHGE